MGKFRRVFEILGSLTALRLAYECAYNAAIRDDEAEAEREDPLPSARMMVCTGLFYTTIAYFLGRHAVGGLRTNRT